MRRFGPLALTLLALAGVAACSSTEDAEAPPAARCPSAAILDGADRIAVPPPAVTEDPADLRYVAALSGIRSACRYVDEAVEIDLGFNVIAQRGPALEGDRIDLSYFVAAVGPGQEILSKHVLDAGIEFPEAQRTAGMVETMTLRLPIASPAEAVSIELYVGFQLDRAERRPPPPLLPE